MKIRPLNKIVAALFAVFSALGVSAQTGGGKPLAVEDKLAQSYNATYNLKFQEAFKAADEARAMAQDDPLPFIAQAWAVFYRELDRLHVIRSEMFTKDDTFNNRTSYAWDAASKAAFDGALDHAEKLAQERLNRDQNDIRALLALSLSNGLRGDDMGLFTRKDLKALGYIKTATDYAEKLLARAPDSYDAYVASGLGKYVIGRKAAPVRWMLRVGGYKGDEQEGMKELALAAERARYMAPFAKLLVAFEDMRKNNPDEARRNLEQLHRQFPNNPLFVEELNKVGRTSARLQVQGD